MATNYGPRVITDGLVLALDAADPNSYPGSGSTLTDLTGNGYNGTISGTVSYSSGNAGYLYANPGNFIDIPINLGGAQPHTIFTIAGYNGAARQRITSTNSNNWLLGHWSGSNHRHFAEGWITPSSGGTTTEDWIIYACTGNQSTDAWQYYENGTLLYSNTDGSNGPTSIRIGGIGNGETSDWKWSMLLAYNRVLTASEIQQNFNALRGRFGI
jgi:hypothetical protein